MRSRPTLVAIAIAAVAAVPLAAPAAAAPQPVVSGLAGPLSFSVDHGTVVVSQNFGGKLTRVDLDGSGRRDLVTLPPSVEVGGVEASGPGTLFTLTGKKTARLMHVTASGTVTTRAHLRAFEARRNPDRRATYGFTDLSRACAARVPKRVGGGSPQHGIVDSHPFATRRLGNGDVLVADAAGNDILRVRPDGRISVVAVLPPQPSVITARGARALHLPRCTVGHTYLFEPVPTDVEVHRGQLYVSTLPGGPEDPSLGARGSVYRVDLETGRWARIGRGFLGATDLAVSRRGRIYVAELFGNRVSTIRQGVARKVATVNQPSAVEIAGGRLWATRAAMTNGAIVRVPR